MYVEEGSLRGTWKGQITLNYVTIFVKIYSNYVSLSL